MKTKTLRQLLVIAVVASLPASTVLRAEDRDDRIEDAFKKTYIYKTQLNDTDISVSSKEGVVTLTGKVNTSEQKRLAEDTARGLPGVTAVEDRLSVTNEPKESSDEWIALKVRGALLFHRNVSVDDTKVNVADGVVTLTGTATSQAERELAAQYARDVKGVKRVENDIRVVDTSNNAVNANERDRSATSDHARTSRPMGDRIDDASITAQIKYALAAQRSTSAIRTEVSTQDGMVTIRGEAQNGAEKDLVTKLAENVNGVQSVHNMMTVRE